MIICIIGGIGSGKSLSCVKIISESSNYPLTNFNLNNINYKRIKLSDIYVNKGDDKHTDLRINWPFWEKMRKKSFSIYIDEAQNVINARSSMSKQNKVLNKWVSQIRKITSDSPDNHLYIITQRPRMIDVIFRELTQIVITCRKIEYKEKVFILQKYFNGFDSYNMNICSGKSYFLGNPYFKFYNTKETIHFEDVETYL